MGTYRQKWGHTDRNGDIRTHRWIEMGTYRQRNGDILAHTDLHTYRNGDVQTDRHRKWDRRTQRWIEMAYRDTDRQKWGHTDTRMCGNGGIWTHRHTAEAHASGITYIWMHTHVEADTCRGTYV